MNDENQELKSKLEFAEQNVANFIKEMGNLLAQHEPPSAVKRAIEEAMFPKSNAGNVGKNFKMSRTKAVRNSRAKGASPEDKMGKIKRSVDRKARLHFD